MVKNPRSGWPTPWRQDSEKQEEGGYNWLRKRGRHVRGIYFVAGASDACAGGDRLRHLLGSLADLLPCCHCSPSCQSVSGSTNKFSTIVANVNKFPAGNTSTSCSLSSTGLQWVTAATTHVFTEYTAWVLSHQTILKIIQNNPQNCENIPRKPKNHENNPKKLKIILENLKVILKIWKLSWIII